MSVCIPHVCFRVQPDEARVFCFNGDADKRRIGSHLCSTGHVVNFGRVFFSDSGSCKVKTKAQRWQHMLRSGLRALRLGHDDCQSGCSRLQRSRGRFKIFGAWNRVCGSICPILFRSRPRRSTPPQRLIPWHHRLDHPPRSNTYWVWLRKGTCCMTQPAVCAKGST